MQIHKINTTESCDSCNKTKTAKSSFDQEMAHKTSCSMTSFEFDFDDPKPHVNFDHRLMCAPVTSRESFDDLSLLNFNLNRGRQRQSVSSNNPLLDTISTIEDFCDLDDYDDVDPSYYKNCVHCSPTRKPSFNEVDREIGYVGSNSIDSGYKSSCPTPDLSEGVYYFHECGGKAILPDNNVKFGPSGPLVLNNGIQKPRIPMGTRVMTRQMKFITGEPRIPRHVDNGISQCIQSSLHPPSEEMCNLNSKEVYLEDLVKDMSLHSANPSHRPRMPSPRRSQQILHSNQNLDVDCNIEVLSIKRDRKDPSEIKNNSKAVRFNSNSSDTHSGVLRKVMCPKPILKDPLCETLRCEKEWCPQDKNVPMFEDEIDTFLHGKAQYYDLEVVSDLASGMKTREKSPNSHEDDQNCLSAYDKTADGCHSFPGTRNNSGKETLPLHETLISRNGSLKDVHSDSMSENSYTSRVSSNNYHVYEEILYDMIRPKPRLLTPPPPLPARPISLKSRKSPVSELHLGNITERNKEPFPNLKTLSPSIPNCLPEKCNRGKQKGNLYTLWRSQGSQETHPLQSRVNQQRQIVVTADDEYGFSIMPHINI